MATLWISSWMRTVLPTPAPPNRPTLPPRTNGAIRSMTLIPVSKTSIFGDRSRKAGRIAVDRPALDAVRRRRLLVDRLADHVPEPPERRLADRDRDRPSEVDDVDAPREAVGRVHGDRADAVVAEVLLHLGDQVVAVHGDAEGAVDLGEIVREERVDDDALDFDHFADVLTLRLLRHASPGEVVSGVVPARRWSRPLSALSLAKRWRERPRSPRRLALRMSSSIAATREAWSRLQTCEVTSEGNTAPNSTPRRRLLERATACR